MPKVHGTRKEKAQELLERIKRGPSFSDIGLGFTVAEAAAQYKIWFESWILSQLVELVPELKPKKD
jgi:hypothetical protein